MESKEIPWYWSHEDYVKWRSPEGLESCPKPAPSQNLLSRQAMLLISLSKKNLS